MSFSTTTTSPPRVHTKATATRKQSHQQHNHRLHQSDQQKQQKTLRAESADASMVPAEQAPTTDNTGILTRLDETNKQAAERTIQRLHRNLGHPNKQGVDKTPQEPATPATSYLKQQQTTTATYATSTNHHHNYPRARYDTAPHSTTAYWQTHFGFQPNSHNIQDTKQDKTIPILAIMDANTKLMAARVLDSEKTPDFIQALERAWIRHFGPPTTLQIDDHRGWSSEALRNWASDHGVFLNINPGQAHARLGLLERRHQVLRRAVELYLADNATPITRDSISQALTYVIPQINNTPNLQRIFSNTMDVWICPKATRPPDG